VLLSDLPRSDSISALQGASMAPARCGGFALLGLFDEQRVSVYGFPAIGLTPPKINKQHTMPAGILQQLLLLTFKF
jgi:hypothetical protein